MTHLLATMIYISKIGHGSKEYNVCMSAKAACLITSKYTTLNTAIS